MRFYSTLKESNANYPTNLFSNYSFTLGVTVTVYSPRELYETLTSGAIGDSYLGGTCCMFMKMPTGMGRLAGTPREPPCRTVYSAGSSVEYMG